MLDIIFLELQYIFKSGIHANILYTLLKKCPSTKEIATLRGKTLVYTLSKASKGHYKEDYTLQLKSHANLSISIKDTSISMYTSQLVLLIEMLDSQINNIEKEVVSHIDEKSTILTIPRINNIVVATIIGEINNLSNFDSPSMLLAFSELNPRVRQSRNFNALSCKMSKKGYPYLPYTLIFATWNLVRNSKRFKEILSNVKDS